MSRFSDLFSNSDVSKEDIKPVIESTTPEPVELKPPVPYKSAKKTLRRK